MTAGVVFLGALRQEGWDSGTYEPSHRHRITTPRAASSTRIPLIATTAAIFRTPSSSPAQNPSGMTREPRKTVTHPDRPLARGVNSTEEHR
jgi:hypothetical protein